MELRIEVKDILTNRSEFYSFDKETIIIGRNPEHDIALKNKYISDTHATIINSNKEVYIKDENSSNGSEIYTNYRWLPLDKKKKKLTLPVQIKLSEAVIITIQSGESQIISLAGVESDSYIMVLDICDSTDQAGNNEQIAYHLKQRLNHIAKPILYDVPVLFYKNTGDGFLSTFSKSTEAVNTAIKILKELEKRNNTTKNPPINVRIGLHKGRTYMIDPATEDIHGVDINITFRIEGLKRSNFRGFKKPVLGINRILTSEAFHSDFIKKSKRKGEFFTDCGLAKLKGIKEKMKIFKINWK